MLCVNKRLAVCFMIGENIEKNQKLVVFFLSSEIIKSAFIDFKERESENAMVVDS